MYMKRFLMFDKGVLIGFIVVPEDVVDPVHVDVVRVQEFPTLPRGTTLFLGDDGEVFEGPAEIYEEFEPIV